MRIGGLVFLCFLSIFFLPSLSLRGVKEHTYLNPGRNFIKVETFAFLHHGTLSFRRALDYQQHDSFFLCSPQELNELLKMKDHFRDICTHKISKLPCEINMKASVKDHVIENFNQYTFGFLSCESSGSSEKVKVEYQFLNPGSELSAVDLPLLIVYPVFMALWVVALVVVGVILVRAHYASKDYDGNQVTAPTFYYCLIFVFFSKLVVVALTWGYWFQFHRDGNRDSILKQIAHMAYAVSECFLFTFLLLFANGWSVLTVLDPGKFGPRWSYFLVIISPFLFLFYFDPIASLLMMYLFLPPLLFSDLTQNIKYLEFRMMWVESVEDEVDEEESEIWRWTLTSLTTKHDVFEAAIPALVLYLSLLVLSQLSIFLLPWYLEFLTNVFHELVVLWFCLKIFWILRPSLAEEGLFWVAFFGDDLESQRDWFEATRHAYVEYDSLRRKNKLLSSYEYVMKNLHLIQYISKEQTKKTGEEEEGAVRNLWLAVLSGRNLSLEVGKGGKEREERVEMEEEEEEEEEEVYFQRRGRVSVAFV